MSFQVIANENLCQTEVSMKALSKIDRKGNSYSSLNLFKSKEEVMIVAVLGLRISDSHLVMYLSEGAGHAANGLNGSSENMTTI